MSEPNVSKLELLADVVRELVGLGPKLQLTLMPPDLSFAQFHVLQRIAKEKEINQKTLLMAFETSSQASGISMLLRRMESSGWIQRQTTMLGEGRLRRRRQVISLTEAGTKKFGEGQKHYFQALKKHMGGLKESELESLHELLGVLRAKLGAPRRSKARREEK